MASYTIEPEVVDRLLDQLSTLDPRLSTSSTASAEKALKDEEPQGFPAPEQPYGAPKLVVRRGDRLLLDNGLCRERQEVVYFAGRGPSKTANCLEDEVEAGYENWRKTFERLESPVPVLIENTAGGDNAMARRFDMLARLWDEVGEFGAGFCLDTCHAFAAGEDLVVTPHARVQPGERLRIAVRHTSDPVSRDVEGGWVRTGDGLAMANQADVAHRVFPCNDHPADKAQFTFRVTAPKGLTAVANGLPLAEERRADTTTWAYRTRHPMATELAQVSIGRSTVLHRTGPYRLPVRDVVPTKDREQLEPWLKKTPDQISWMEDKVGRYPFETYGVLVADARTGFELETQTLSLFEKELFTRPEFPEWYVESIMVHELAHQWFGDSVSPATWSDLWLNEGHATWYEALYAEEKARQPLEKRMRYAYRLSDSWRAAGGPPAAPKGPRPGEKISIFRPVVYDGSALVLYALRQEIGRSDFEAVERAWVHTYRDGNATTADFVRLASEVSGRNLDGFFDAWLYGAKTPPMPGHPDWTSTPPEKKAASGKK